MAMSADTKRIALAFQPTPAVTASRSRRRFVDCSVCQTDNSQYLFHRAGVRFVRCRGCGAVYVNPVDPSPVNYFNIARSRPPAAEREHKLALSDFESLLQRIAFEYERVQKCAPIRALLVGKFHPDFAELPTARRIGLQVAEIDDAHFRRLTVEGETDQLRPLLEENPVVVILHELLEGCSDPGAMTRKLVDALREGTWFVVTYTNVASLPARMMRRHWPPFFSLKTTFLNTGHLTALFARFGLGLHTQFPLPVSHTLAYIAERLRPNTNVTRALEGSALGQVTMPIRAGNRVAIFRARPDEDRQPEKLSIIIPVFNEARYCATVIDAVLAKELSLEKEVIIVESNSEDGTRDIVKAFSDHSGVKVILEESPQGKGHAVRRGLEAATGTIILIQDADFEYDIDDYDALLDPILQHRSSFVLGSRSLGLDDWKVRRFGGNQIRGLILNAAQVLFARTFNLMYQQSVTDINTMFKVFRRSCLDDFELTGTGFELDIELVCKLTRQGHSPMEVPVNYVSRSFAEGKKIRFGRDSVLSYLALFRYRLPVRST